MENDLISRQTAIDALKKISFSHWFECGEYLSEDTREIEIINSNKALEVIEALPSAQPEHCGDAVSRNAIIQKLNKMDRYVSAELRLCDTDKKFPQNEVFIVDDVYEEIVEQLPSVQPRMGKWIYHIDDLFPAESTMECNQCHAEQPLTCDDEFCPHCGAKMEVTT